jgi:hypothetical protein
MLVITKHEKSDPLRAVSSGDHYGSLKYKEFIVYYTNKTRRRVRKKGIGAKMRMKLAAKLLIIASTLMKKKEP